MSESQRIPPQAIEAEQSILGSMLQNAQALDVALSLLKPSHFYLPKHRKIFAAISELRDDGDVVDLITTPDRLTRRGELAGVGGRKYLCDLTDSVVNFAAVDNHCRMVKEASVKNQLIYKASEITNRAYDPAIPLAELTDFAERGLLEILQDVTTGGAVPIRQVARDVLKGMEHIWEHGPSGIPTGHADLDELIVGIEPTDLVVIGGRPGMGKTALLLTLATNWALKGLRIHFLTFEMSDRQLTRRIVASLARVDAKIIRNGKRSTSEERDRWREAEKQVEKLPIIISQCSGNSVQDIKSLARQSVMKQGIDVFLVDYLQLIRPSGGINKEQQIALISQGLRELPLQINVPVVVASQLNRKVEDRGRDSRPQLSDFRDSGAIEQDAYIAIFVWHNELIVSKCRDGETGIVPAMFMKQFSRWELVDKRKE